MFVGGAVRNYDLWTAEGMAYDKLILKMKDYARNKKLDGEARKGKQAVDIGRIQDWSDLNSGDKDNEDRPGADQEEVNALTGVKCYLCHKKGRVATNCPKRRGKGNDKGKGKGKGNGEKEARVIWEPPNGRLPGRKEDVGIAVETISKIIAHPWPKVDK